MLTDRELDEIIQPVTDLYQEATTNAVNKMARELSRINYTGDNWQEELALAVNAAFIAVMAEISRLNKKAEQTLQKQIEIAARKSIEFDVEVYKDAGIDVTPIENSDRSKAILSEALRFATTALASISASAAVYARTTFSQAADRVRRAIEGGQEKNTALKSAIKALVAAGLLSATGAKPASISSQAASVSLAVVQRSTAEVQGVYGDEAEIDLVQVSAHFGARPSHQVWQGKIYSRSGTDPRYPDFVSSTGYGTVTGLHGINCRHSFYPYIEGVSEKMYSKKQLYEMQDKEVRYNGEYLTVYEATQKQRYLENGLRKWSDYSEALKSANIPNAAEQAKVIEWSGRLTDLLKQTGLPRVR